MAGPVLTSITDVVIQSMPVIKLAILGVLAAFMAALVVYKAVLMLTSAVKGERVMYGGKFYDADVWQSAMNDLKRQERSGVALDADSRKALRKHQGLK